MSRDGFEFGDRAPSTKYRNPDGSITNFKTGAGSVPIDQGVSSSKNSRPTATPNSTGKAQPGQGVYQDAILRHSAAEAEGGVTSYARTGKDQPREKLRYPLERGAYFAEVIFRPVKSDSIIDDLNGLLTGKSNLPSSADEEGEFDRRDPSIEDTAAGGNEFDSRDPAVAAAANKRTEKRKNKPEVENSASRGARQRGLVAEDVKQFEGGNPELDARIEAYNAAPIPIGPECRLYFPQAIQITDGVQVGPIDLGVAGAVTEAAVKAGATGIGELAQKALANSDIASIVDVFKSKNLQSTAGAFAAQRAARAFGAQGVAGAISRATNLQVNPNTRSLFRAVNLREFSFTFKLIATSPAEAEQIKAIIRFFRTELYPEEIVISSKEASGSVAYRMPNRFDIQFRYNDNQEIATKIKPAYLRNFTATYNPTGMAMHRDGNFSEIDITMSFVEDTTLNRRDVAQGGY